MIMHLEKKSENTCNLNQENDHLSNLMPMLGYLSDSLQVQLRCLLSLLPWSHTTPLGPVHHLHKLLQGILYKASQSHLFSQNLFASSQSKKIIKTS
jgi:hypothetical protein